MVDGFLPPVPTSAAIAAPTTPTAPALVTDPAVAAHPTRHELLPDNILPGKEFVVTRPVGSTDTQQEERHTTDWLKKQAHMPSFEIQLQNDCGNQPHFHSKGTWFCLYSMDENHEKHPKLSKTFVVKDLVGSDKSSRRIRWKNFLQTNEEIVDVDTSDDDAKGG